MASEIPRATLAAGDQSDPAWWLACAETHESAAARYRANADADMQSLAGRGYFDALAQQCSAAALACRTFAAMMERKADAVTARADDVAAFWVLNGDGSAYAFAVHGILPRSLPAAAVAALTEDE
jgi:hypothetical protein